MRNINENDWKTFRKHISSWQEAYMDKLNKEYIDILTSDENASEKFWKLEKRIKSDKRDTGVIAEMKRSMLIENLCNLLIEGAITMDDLSLFSEDTQETVKFLTKRYMD